MSRATLDTLIEAVGVPVTRRFVQAGAIRTHCLEAGTGPPVVLLHGAGAGAVTWYPVIGPLSACFRALAPDVVGYGESDKPMAPYDTAFYVSWLADFLEAEGIDKASLVGSSQGGAIALNFALAHPQRVARLALVGSAALGRVGWGGVLRLMWLNSFPSMAAQRSLNSYLACQEHIHPAWSQYSLEGCRRPGGTRAFWLGMGRAVRPLSARRLQQVRHPVLLLWGAQDRFFPLHQAQTAQKWLPQAELRVIPQARHLPFFDRPEEFNAALLDFLGSMWQAPHLGYQQAP